MISISPVEYYEKLCRVWTRRRQAPTLLRVCYDVRRHSGCRIYCLHCIQELE